MSTTKIGPKGQQVRALRERRAVDTSDIPETGKSFFKRAKLRTPKKPTVVKVKRRSRGG